MINCLFPEIYINPAVYEAVGFSHKIICDGRTYYFNGVSRLFRRPLYEHLKYLLSNITQENLQLFYTFDRFMQKVFLFIAVPCRKCILCQQQDENVMSQRLMMESECHPCEPYFVTLTFAHWSLPKDNNPTQRHIEMYMKRLRNYTDALGYNIRFYAQGEHGKQKGRAHLHFLIFGLPDMPHSTAQNLFEKPWRTRKRITKLVKGKLIKIRLPYGIVYVTQINDPNYVAYYEKKNGRKLRPSDGLRYCCKYSSKASYCRSWSKGLGKDFAMRFQNSMREIAKKSVIRSDWHLSYKNKYGKPQQIIMSRWFLHCVFPTFNRSTYYFRKRLYDHIAFIVSTRSDYLNLLDRLPCEFIAVVPELVDKKYCSKIFSNMRERTLFKGRKEYLRLLRYLASNKFLTGLYSLPLDQYKENSMLYNNFCKLYFSLKPDITPGILKANETERLKYINKSLNLQSL